MSKKDLEFFTVILSDQRKIKLKFSDEIKRHVPINVIESEMKESVSEHLTPIIEELVNLLLNNGMEINCCDMNGNE